MSTETVEIKSDVLQALVNNNITLEQVKEWGTTTYPLVRNVNIIGRLYLRSKGIFLNVTSNAKIATLVKDTWVTLDILVASKLDAQKYTGCPNCNKSIKEAKVGEDAECPKCGLVEAVTILWPRYIAGDDTGEIILKFNPTTSDNEDYTGSFLKVRGKLNEYKGNITFDVNKIEGVTTPKGTAPSAIPAPIKKDKPTAKPAVVTTSPTTPATEVIEDPITAPQPTTQQAPAELSKEAQQVLSKFANFIKLYEQTGDIDTPKMQTWFDKQQKALNLTITIEHALDKLGYQMTNGNIVKKA